MKLKRSITAPIGWVLDNLVPPVVRDSRWFMGPAMRLLFGDKASHFQKFKERAPFLSPEEMTHYYRLLADVHIDRETDISRECMEKILNNIVGESVLDIACGRGTLSRRIHSGRGRAVTGVDILPPEARSGDDPVFLPGSVEVISFPDDSFDTVVSAHTLEHVLDIERAVSELRRVARRRLIIVVPRQRNYRFTFDLHLHFFPYVHTLQLLMRNPQGEVALVGNDLYYQEDYS